MNNSLVTKQANNLEETRNQFGTNSVVQSSEMTKTMAEVQSRVIMAKQFPRNVVLAENRIRQNCERKSLAKVAEYEYPRGGTKVSGASIKLLEVVAQCYGNVQFGWDVVSRDEENHISHCKAFAWDLENNIYTEIKYDVPHIREKKGGNVYLTDPRDIYEMEANQSSRRVRKCLENVVPRDLVEQALEWCNETLSNNFDVQGTLNQMIDYFKENYNVSLEQIEEHFGCSRQAFNKNTMLSLTKLYNSIVNGMKKVEEIFPPIVKETSVKEQTIVSEASKKAEKKKVESFNTTSAPNDLFMGDF